MLPDWSRMDARLVVPALWGVRVCAFAPFERPRGSDAAPLLALWHVSMLACTNASVACSHLLCLPSMALCKPHTLAYELTRNHPPARACVPAVGAARSQAQAFRRVHAEMISKMQAIVVRYAEQTRELVLVPVFVRAGGCDPPGEGPRAGGEGGKQDALLVAPAARCLAARGPLAAVGGRRGGAQTSKPASVLRSGRTPALLGTGPFAACADETWALALSFSPQWSKHGCLSQSCA